MPKENIDRAIKKGTGELAGARVEEVIYEGYGPGGVAVMCDILTDNRNRTAPELRKLFEVHGGKLGSSNCVAYLFDRKGLFVIDSTETDEETLMEAVLEAGGDDVRTEDDKFHVTCEPDTYSEIGAALESAGVPVEIKQITRIPANTVDLDLETSRKVLKLMEQLDDHDDVQNVSANFNIPEEAMAEMGK